MTMDLCISIRFIQPYALYHGRRDRSQPEWLPSPMRLFQALLNAASLAARGERLPTILRQGLEVLEQLRPQIVAPRASVSSVGYRVYVPHNQADLVSSAWFRGNSAASIASHRMEKDSRPMRIETAGDELPTLHYIYPLSATALAPRELLDAIRPSVRAITHLGWGIDQVVGDATLVDATTLLGGERWSPSARTGRHLRAPRDGSLVALTRRHDQFLNRIRDGQWTPVAPLAAFDEVYYRRTTDPVGRPFVVFKLLDDNNDTYTHPHARLVHLAGMVRHLVIETMTKHPFRGVKQPARWVERYVAGHRTKTGEADDLPHSQLSYVPLPSIGHAHTDPGVRRIMIVAPIGDDAVLEHVGRHIDGRRLEPERPEDLRGPVFISRVRHDRVIDSYTSASRSWASFTPVILPGHDDRKPEKTRKLIEKALAQSGVDQRCAFEWSTFSRFPKSYSAHKYVRDDQSQKGNRQAGYIRPNHLIDLTSAHVQLTFEHPIPGPLTIGAGRHCGFGLMVGVSTAEAI
jgi:CRISPR-associated protein Csb2